MMISVFSQLISPFVFFLLWVLVQVLIKFKVIEKNVNVFFSFTSFCITWFIVLPRELLLSAKTGKPPSGMSGIDPKSVIEKTFFDLPVFSMIEPQNLQDLLQQIIPIFILCGVSCIILTLFICYDCFVLFVVLNHKERVYNVIKTYLPTFFADFLIKVMNKSIQIYQKSGKVMLILSLFFLMFINISVLYLLIELNNILTM